MEELHLLLAKREGMDSAGKTVDIGSERNASAKGACSMVKLTHMLSCAKGAPLMQHVQKGTSAPAAAVQWGANVPLLSRRLLR